MKNVIFVEDDELFALDVRMMLEECYDGIKIVRCTSAENAEQVLKNVSPDLLLIDVVLEDDRAGIRLAELVKQKNIPLIFMTAYRRKDLFMAALKVNPSNYLQKPFSKTRLKQAIALALRQSENKKNIDQSKAKAFLTLKRKDGKLERIKTNEICLLEAFGNYCHIYTLERRFTQRMVLKNFAEVLPITDFVRIHRNFVINVNHLSTIDVNVNMVTVRGTEYPFSMKYKAGLLKMLSRL